MNVSPLAPEAFPELPAVAGVELRTFAAGLRYHGRPDLFLATMPDATTVGGVFTKSQCASATVDWCRSIIASGTARAVVCNAGNANAFTGVAGVASVQAEVNTLGESLNIDPNQIYVASTGVIGEPLDDDAMKTSLGELGAAPIATWQSAATAITTTDTFIKGASASLAGGNVVGIAKGSGMIAPNMATMLGFVFTDLAVTASACQTAIAQATQASFNKITVDSDTSTSDTVLLFATAQAGNDPIDGPEHREWAAFSAAVFEVCLDLAHQIVRDGEGATKFIEVQVNGATSDEAAETIARSIADSPLVKTALAAEDANWGRVVMAIGKAGAPADRDLVDIWIGDEQITSAGQVHAGYSEDRANAHLQGDEILVRVELGLGEGSSSIWTCDLTHGYIEINAGYRS